MTSGFDALPEWLKISHQTVETLKRLPEFIGRLQQVTRPEILDTNFRLLLEQKWYEGELPAQSHEKGKTADAKMDKEAKKNIGQLLEEMGVESYVKVLRNLKRAYDNIVRETCDREKDLFKRYENSVSGTEARRYGERKELRLRLSRNRRIKPVET